MACSQHQTSDRNREKQRQQQWEQQQPIEECETRGVKICHHKRQHGGEYCQALTGSVCSAWICFLCAQLLEME